VSPRRQAAELEQIDPASTRAFTEDREQRVRRGHLGVAKRADQQQRRIPHRRREELQQQQ
jgi:hypothetical protein